MKSSAKKGKAVGEVASLREHVICAPCIEEPPSKGNQPKGNPSSAGGPKPKRDGNRNVRNKGRK